MLTDLLPPIHIEKAVLAGMGLWSLALYLGFFPIGEWFMEQFARWMNFADRAFYTSTEEYERTRKGRESQNAFYASLLSVIPFTGVGGLCYWLIENGLGRSWAVSIGILACIGCGVYELGRRDGQSLD
ncbi:MAG TPA: hypothetical protein V6D10_25975 [Trichocoleus sp.]|jgi:hypothetical protein